MVFFSLIIIITTHFVDGPEFRTTLRCHYFGRGGYHLQFFFFVEFTFLPPFEPTHNVWTAHLGIVQLGAASIGPRIYVHEDDALGLKTPFTSSSLQQNTFIWLFSCMSLFI